MRILHLTNHIQEIGNGIVNVAVDLACLQAKDGHDVAIASAGGEYELLLQQHGAKHFPLNQSRTPLNIIKAAGRYRSIIQEFQPDIVHGHMMTGVVLARTLRFGYHYGLIATVHNAFQRSAVLMGLGDRVIVVSKAVGDLMAKRGIPWQKMRVVANGTLGSPRNRRQLKDYQPSPLQHPAITTVSGMYRRKGVGELIDAFAEIAEDFPDAHLYLVGNGPDRESLEQQARKKPSYSRIHFEGFQSEPKPYLLATDIFVLASYFDSSPLVIPEAREAGCAIIGSNVDGIPEALDGGEAGILIPARDSKSLAASLAKLLSNSDLQQSWRNLAAQNLERLNVARVHKETLLVYKELILN
ncbi:glycosyltransferase family 4 protein [Iningainema tapete]|uniref:Glycosyltransferase family 4 protein n=1 Tax=Iningainema tapete BLCC-T55 TaxID=2748662 RepID=A0A8J7CF83_9CYAN|nr:glycosyltransferase family 4 protein [Iningainema tapete]MBD2774465.1 glycosyltransferase family 4 protein [Iningainema tapete BLCC-T55]